MNLSQLEVLVALTETGSFTEAADRIGLTRSAASYALANLEAELGVPLIERERGNAVPTAIGNCILYHAREILSRVETIQQEAAEVRGLRAGKLRIGVISSISARILSGILRKFRQEYPDIEVVTFEGTARVVADWIQTNTVDVGFVVRPSDGIESLTIGRDTVRVIVPLNHNLRNKRDVSMETLSQQPFIMPKSACDFFDTSTDDSELIGFQKHYEASDVQTILAMVREGLGITMLPEMLLPLQLDGVHMLSLNPPMSFTYGVGVRSMRSASPAAKLFMQSAQSWAVAQGYAEVGEELTLLAEERVTE